MPQVCTRTIAPDIDMDPAVSTSASSLARLRPGWELPPVVERELRMAARRGVTYWSRVGGALTAIVIAGWWMAAHTALTPSRQTGLIIFRVLALLAGVATVNSILHLTAEAFAREKREDTLGFLFLTPLKPRDIVVGKLVSSTLRAFYQFLAVVPVLALPMLGGGVSFGEFILFVLALVNFAFFCAALGLYVSAKCWDENRARTVATLSLLGIVALVPVLGAIIGLKINGQSVFQFLLGFSPAYALWQATVTGFRQPLEFWISVGVAHGAGWWFLLATCRLLPHCWQQKPPSPEPGRRLQRALRRRETWESPAPPPRLPAPANVPPVAAARRSVRSRFDSLQRAELLDRQPVVWFALRWRAEAAVSQVLWILPVVALVVALLTGGVMVLVHPVFVLFVAYSLNAGLKSYAATQAALAFARDRVENSLELLLSTPLTPRELVEGHALVVRGHLRKFVRHALVIESLWLLLALGFNAGSLGTDGMVTILIGGALIIGFLVPDLKAVAWASLWEGASSRDSRTAASNAQAKVLILPWAAVMVLGVAAGFLGLLNGGPWLVLAIMAGSSGLADWWFSRRARELLATQLPQRALARAAGEQEYHDLWMWLGRWLGRGWRRVIGAG